MFKLWKSQEKLVWTCCEQRTDKSWKNAFGQLYLLICSQTDLVTVKVISYLPFGHEIWINQGLAFKTDALVKNMIDLTYSSILDILHRTIIIIIICFNKDIFGSDFIDKRWVFSEFLNLSRFIRKGCDRNLERWWRKIILKIAVHLCRRQLTA